MARIILMTTGKKYRYKIERKEGGWLVQITRQVTSRKMVTTKQRADFPSESQAQEWADKELAELMRKQVSRNQRRGEQRKAQELGREERSTSRAEKTKEKKAGESVIVGDQSAGENEESDDWSEELKLIKESEI